MERILADLSDRRIRRRGLSLSGGDPLHPDNILAITELVQRVKEACPDKDIWLWTGFQLAELDVAQRQLIDDVDVLIDGKFEQSLADPNLLWRGSSNQVIYRREGAEFIVAEELMKRSLNAKG